MTDLNIRRGVNKYIGIFLAFVISYFFVFSYVAHAAPIGLSTSESLVDVEVPPGGEVSDEIFVFNDSPEVALPVHIELSLWNLREDSDDIEFVRAEEALNATRWFTLESYDFILEPSEIREIPYGVSPPADAPPGSYFVMMRFQTALPEHYFEESGPRFVPELGVLYFIKVPFISLDGAREEYGARIASLEPEGAGKVPLLDRFLPRANAGVFDKAVRELVAKIENTGIYHFKASGSVEIKNIFGRTVASAEIPARYLLPNRTRAVDVALLPPPTEEGLPFLQRVLRTTHYVLRTNSYFGPYTATVTLSVPNGTPVVESVSFWVIPWKFWLLVGLLALGVAFIIKRGRGRFSLAMRILFRRGSE